MNRFSLHLDFGSRIIGSSEQFTSASCIQLPLSCDLTSHVSFEFIEENEPHTERQCLNNFARQDIGRINVTSVN
ncbi:hypothetical protein HBH53_222330 [Parastagonospora nodorum]|nr:hypothetical protein HBH53_222330 [Parastagonospora nodorum]KAH4043373.1 hypothetical protein HBH49_233200 [Parastagonospora nodorum]KAH4843207.1 hypothetical protein HBH75_205810 [Parastagonospora nodorum]KAH4923487.1 hypothetical protein HBI79_167960 [Parastagonospora nodorum]KAH5147895.1 hypothetical protein HBH69_165100 [Parastagonospora nodorum]